MSRDSIDDSFQRWNELGWEGADSMAAFMSVLQVHQLLVDRVHGALRATKMTITEHATLTFLAMSEGERRSLSQIAKRMMIGAGRCNYMINKLEGLGYLQREPHPFDGRTTLAVLTDEGRAAAMEGIRRVIEIHHGFGDTPPDELQAIRHFADGLLQAERVRSRRRRDGLDP